MLSIQIKHSYPVIAGYALGSLYLIILVVAFKSYYLWNVNLFIGLALAPYICSTDKGKFSVRYLIPSVILIALAAFIPVKTTLFLATLFSFLFFLENYIGKISSLILFLLLLISPIFKYISNVLGFPIRLWLSEVAASVLKIAGTDTHSFGNLIMQGNNEFAVDQACAGLNMLATSLIICLFILAWYQKRMCCQFSIYQVICLLILTIILNILCNLIRIILLVQFKIAPELIYHDLIGIICLLVYVIIPLVLVVKWLGSNYALKSPAQTKDLHPFPKLRFPILHISLVITLVLISVNLKNMNQIVPHINSINLQGYQKKTLNNGILKFENSESLVYLKSGTFYAPEHDPMVCWKGSGYTFKSIKKEKYASTEVYTGVLEKGNDTIYSAWWFTNGKLNTVNQFKWRWKAAKGEGDFYLVNINVQNASDLKRLTTALLSKNLGL